MTHHSLTTWFPRSYAYLTHPQLRTSHYCRRQYTHYPRHSPSNATPLSPRNTPSPALRGRPDPFTLVSSDLTSLRTSLLTLLHSGHPALSEMAEYYFRHPSKQIRSLLVLLFSQATNGLGTQWPQKLARSSHEGGRGRWGALDRPLNRPDVLNDWNPRLDSWTGEFCEGFEIKSVQEHGRMGTGMVVPPLASTQTNHLSKLHTPSLILPTQSRLAQILEMMHTASLLHDDVIDGAALRRGKPSAPSAFGKKLSIFGGSFILGRALGALSRLGDLEVTELITSIPANMVDGEMLQLKKVKDQDPAGGRMRMKMKTRVREDAWVKYLQKTYLKTASLMAKGVRAAVVLGGCKEGDVAREIAYAYGRNLGIAFQLVDDVLDYESASATLGKPGGADLQLGLATGPALYAWEEHPDLGELIQRKFSKKGDVERAREFISRSEGIQRTRALAQLYGSKAKDVIQPLPDSDAKLALEILAERVVDRKS